ncbi:hypothetical protein [Streptomyces somaliensis]|uniref:hypothetical protein n=1 Tax=Streptomyces somaliensis TaxID=78355 RepID=UPI0034E94557
MESTTSPMTAVIQAKAAQPTGPTATAPSSPWTTAHVTSRTRPHRPGAARRTPARSSTAPHRAR